MPAAGAAREPGPRRVLIVVQNLPVPFDRRVWLEATTLARAGYAVSVICPKMKGLNAGFERAEGVDIYRYWLPGEAQGAIGFVAEFAWCFVMVALLTVRVALFGRGFDLLHACNPPETYWPLGLFWRLFGKVFVFDHHDLSPEMFAAKFEGAEGGLLFKALLFMERMTFRAAQVVITTNESHKALAISRGGKRAGDVWVVRSGPDLSRFRVRERSPAWSNGKRFMIAYLGEICKQDGVDHLVRAVKLMRDELGRQDVQCVVMGGGPHREAIARYAADEGVADCCRFLGRVSDDTLCEVLSSADLGIDPGPKNAWSDQSTMNKVVEYMYFGLPVVAYDMRETRVSADAAGFYAEANDERALARAIRGLLDDDAARAAMGRTGMARVREQLAWDYSAPVLLAAYEQAFALRQGARRAEPNPGACPQPADAAHAPRPAEAARPR